MKAVSLSDSLQHLPTIFFFRMKNRPLCEIMPINKWSWIISWSVEEADGVWMLRFVNKEVKSQKNKIK